ncbi:MAG: YraN family protein [Butyrivibrio sp.]|nr:YraN family protein [Butyrivibrio sp.]
MNNRKVGTGFERIAADHIRSRGGTIVALNYRLKSGEIDIIAKDGDYLCFIEVKYRKNMDFGGPLAAISFKKQLQICKISKLYLYFNNYPLDTKIRYDVIAISGENKPVSVNWLKNAFDYVA